MWLPCLCWCVHVWCRADHIEWALVQLLLFDAQLTHPGQQLRRRDEETRAQQEGKHIGFLQKNQNHTETKRNSNSRVEPYRR